MISFEAFGIKIQIQFLFVALVTIFLLADRSGISIIALLACLIHEMGHLIMFCLVGYKPLSLSFEITGIRLTKPIAQLNYWKELLVELAGSFLNFTMFVLLANTTNQISLVSIFAVTHLIVGVFNLVPLKSFDGGKLLEITLLQFCSVITTEYICTAIDLFFVFMMLIGGVWSFLNNRQSFTLVVLTIYLMITALVKLNQDKEY